MVTKVYDWDVIRKELFFKKVDRETGEVRRCRKVYRAVVLTVVYTTLTGNRDAIPYRFYVARGEVRVRTPVLSSEDPPTRVPVGEFAREARRMWGGDADAILNRVAAELAV
jgi:hypothetical protein